ncbi:MauE/DoxX family redox-associated membrane protein [Streptomyces varsoviensis]|uniref:MauE/DoxX family redox-associated membrane protein n=1 Tax=Streptomyces varsoviensis TaxID=67373 RepID=UPI0033FDDC27
MEQYLAMWVRCLIGLVFLVSAVSKVSGRRSFTEFAEAVGVLAPVPGARRLLAPAVVALEFAVAVLLALPVPVAFRVGAWLAAALLLAFALGVALAVRRGAETACRCFGRSTSRIKGWQAVRNLALAVPAALAATLGPGSQGTAAGLALTAVMGLTCGAVVIALDDIVELFRPATAKTVEFRQEIPHARRDRSSRLRRGAVPAESRPERRNHQTPARPGRNPQPQR